MIDDKARELRKRMDDEIKEHWCPLDDTSDEMWHHLIDVCEPSTQEWHDMTHDIKVTPDRLWKFNMDAKRRWYGRW